MRNYIMSYDETNRLDFTGSVKIPAGFILTSPRDYAIELTLDQSDLYETTITDIKPSQINTERVRSRCAESLRCYSRVRRLHLQGSINYNVIIRAFRPVDPVLTQPSTTFTSNNVLPVSMDLVYRCYEETMPNDILSKFTVDIRRRPEILVDERGRVILRYSRCANEFFEALRSGCCTQYIHVPYSIVVRPIRVRDASELKTPYNYDSQNIEEFYDAYVRQ